MSSVASSGGPSENHRFQQDRTPASQWRIRHVLATIHQQQGNVQLSLKSIGNRLGISGQHLGRAFAASTGISFRSYLRRVRASEAQRLLRHAGLSVKEISFTLGYSEPANFVRDFKRMTNHTPTEYRRHVAVTVSPTNGRRSAQGMSEP